MRNANLKDPTATLTGDDNRPYFAPSGNAATDAANKFIYPNLAGTNRGGSAIVLENTGKGYSFSNTVQLSKAFNNGFYGSMAYTYTLATEVSSNPGSQATSAWQSIINRGTPNNTELYNSAYSVPHRVVGNLSYRKEYAKHFASTISFFYEGSVQSRFSYIVGGDINNDGNNASDLMYIYAKGTDVNFSDFKLGNGTTKYTIAAQQAAYDQLVNNTAYLKKHAGQYAERNSATTPWFNRIDMRFLQDFSIKTGTVKNTLQFSIDIINLPNLISRSAGNRDVFTINNPLSYKSVDANGRAVYNLAEFNGALVTTPFQKDISRASTWGMQLGLRYIF